MEEEKFDDTLRALSSKVNKVTNQSVPVVQSTSIVTKQVADVVQPLSFVDKMKGYVGEYGKYALVPIIAFISLYAWKPNFVCDESPDKEMIISYKKLLVASIVISSILAIGVYGYNYKKTSV